MPFTDTYANSILSWAMGKGALNRLGNIYIGLTSGGGEISGGGYSRVPLVKNHYGQNGTIVSTFPDLMTAVPAEREIKNNAQINWTKATADWPLIDGFILSTSEEVGEISQIYFRGDLDLDEESKARGGLLVSAGSVCLFDPYALRISFPEVDSAL